MPTTMASSPHRFGTIAVALMMLILSCFIAIITAQDENGVNMASTEQMQQLKAQKSVHLNYLEVAGVLKTQADELTASQAKKKLLDTKEAIELSAPFLQALNVTEDQFVAMLSTKQTQLQSVMSLDLELNNLLALTQNSADMVGKNIKDFVSAFTKKAYTTEEYYTTSKEAMNDTVILTPMDSILPNFGWNNQVRRIRNRLAVGLKHVLMLGQNGKLYSTGIAYNGNLGRTNTDSRLLYNLPVEGLDGLQILQFDANYFFSLVLTNDGVYSFGINDYSQLGTGDRNNRLIAGKVYGFGWQTIVQIATGWRSSYAIDTNGKLWAWGDNSKGQLGDRTFSEKNRPFPVYPYGAIGSTPIVRVCGGGEFALALTSNNTLVSWGDNTFGQLGNNNMSVTISGEPVLVYQSGDLAGKVIVDIQCGYDFSMVLSSTGEVFLWGKNDFGQLGVAVTTTYSVVPKKLTTLTNCVASQIFAKHHSAFVLCTDNSLWNWGRNDAVQLGKAASTYEAPQKIDHTLFLTSDFSTLGYPKIIEIATNKFNTFMMTTDFNIWGSGTCGDEANLQYGLFYGDSTSTAATCSRQICSGLTCAYPKNYILTTSNYAKMPTFNDCYLPLHMRRAPYFEIGSRAYLLQTDNVVPTRVGNGFNMFYKEFNESEDAWNVLERDASVGNAFPVSLYNSHFLKSNEFVYFFGGFVNDDLSNAIYSAPIYDVENGWQLLNATLPYPVAAGMTAVINGYLYIFGGITSVYTYTSGSAKPVVSTSVTDKIIRAPLDNLTNWMVVPKVLPSKLHSGHLSIIDKFVYIFGGATDYRKSDWNIYRALLTDPATWEMTFGLLPFYTANAALVATNSQLFLLGGARDSNTNAGNYIAVGYKSDPVKSWMASDRVLPPDASQSLVPVVRNDTVLLYGSEIRRSTPYMTQSARTGRVLKLSLGLY
ncbi:hypothetical protein FDP41_001826 [Naegleria fowleri]|uniref:RCC1-like domain-containing protein n=1 Tax=Naegleria fowleri TaxID=5763 RepID=A0A6A5BU37_NAEFO|nr:uncharacterized protein FDP41_001826 [Naegleria fowleri]KAF0978756.1 hypothetical protein FDP41_001826 [Naegleria fowleri]CAG4718043.1 unnamed protein product [Naegleria fowleri]